MEISELLKVALQRGASDLHLLVPNPPALRINGRLAFLTEWPSLTPEVTASTFRGIASEGQVKFLEEERELDFAYELPGVSTLRVNASYQRGSIALVFRLIPERIPSLGDLGLPEICKQFIQLPRGLVLVTGPTGSGKSSTMAAMLRYLNENYERKVVTIEDPIEFRHPSIKCLICQRELGVDTKSFGEALKRALRQDPEVIMVGEMRDLETISAAITAAETGHLVLSTLHTRGAAESVSRIVDVFPAAQQTQIRTQLAEVLEGVISQVLLRRADGRGRVVACEVMVGTTAIKNLIRENRIAEMTSFIKMGRAVGMKTLDEDIERLLESALVMMDEAMAKAKRLNTPQIIATKPPQR